MYACILLALVLCVHQSVAQQGRGAPGVPPPKQETLYPDGYEPNEFQMKPHDAEHIKEHLKEVIDKPKEEMTEEELEFHYFKLHDYDNNNKLDGTEIVKAITHFHQDGVGGDTELRSRGKTTLHKALKRYDQPDDTRCNGEDGDTEEAKKQQEQAKVFSDEEIANIVDMVIKEDDLNNDGYIEYPEFVTAQRKAKEG